MLDSITVTKTKLLEILLDNKMKHEREFRIVYDNWFNAYNQMLEELKNRALRGKPIPFHLINLNPPKSYVDVYSDVIEMLMITTQQEMVLDSDEFRKLVQDKWEWTQSFSSSSASYSSSSSSSSHVATILEEIEKNYK